MGKLSQFQVVFNRPQSVYFAGEWVQGNVMMNLNEEMKMRGVYLELVGAARVHWSERRTSGSGKRRRTRTVHYSANESYFRNRIVLYGSSGGTTTHPAGNHTFPFQFQLPLDLPSSFEGAWGSVRYYAHCVIDRPWKFDHKTKRAFTVNSQLDLNTLSSALSVPQGQNSKTLCCLCCTSGPIEAVVRLNRQAFVPGESITINAEVTNNTGRRMDRSLVQLVQKTVFHATRKSRTATAVVAQKQRQGVGPGESDSWSSETLMIPPLPPSGLVGCRIIDIYYVLKFVVDPSGPAFDLEVPLNITIGTVPLRTYFSDYSAAAAHAQSAWMARDPTAPPLGFGAVNPSAPMMPPGAPPDAPPPSYQASVFGQVDIKEEDDTKYTMGETSYAPLYPTYNWNSTAYSLPEQPKNTEKD